MIFKRADDSGKLTQVGQAVMDYIRQEGYSPKLSMMPAGNTLQLRWNTESGYYDLMLYGSGEWKIEMRTNAGNDGAHGASLNSDDILNTYQRLRAEHEGGRQEQEFMYDEPEIWETSPYGLIKNV